MSVKKKPLVVVTRKLPDSIETRMRELFDARINLDDTPMSAEQIAEAARRARAFGLQIHYHNRRPVAPKIAEELGATYWESLDQMLARMDIISVNCPHTPATYHLLSARRLKLIRKDAYIVNTARGEVTDEDTLIKLIEAGEIGGAGLDVYEHEPAVNPKLVRLAKAGKAT